MDTMRHRRHTFSCVQCGYGICVSAAAPDRCPMCGGSVWELVAPRSQRTRRSAGPPVYGLVPGTRARRAT
jgi:hypothetical protein